MSNAVCSTNQTALNSEKTDIQILVVWLHPVWNANKPYMDIQRAGHTSSYFWFWFFLGFKRSARVLQNTQQIKKEHIKLHYVVVISYTD